MLILAKIQRARPGRHKLDVIKKKKKKKKVERKEKVQNERENTTSQKESHKISIIRRRQKNQFWAHHIVEAGIEKGEGYCPVISCPDSGTFWGRKQKRNEKPRRQHPKQKTWEEKEKKKKKGRSMKKKKENPRLHNRRKDQTVMS